MKTLALHTLQSHFMQMCNNNPGKVFNTYWTLGGVEALPNCKAPSQLRLQETTHKSHIAYEITLYVLKEM